MSRTIKFGILGGYGATGRVVVSELWKSCPEEILVGGRDLEKGRALAAEFDGRVSATEVDVLDARALDNFCSGCAIIVNCAGPVLLLQDRVAQAALRARCHYIDVAGLTLVKERMLSHSRELAGMGLSCVVSAGWMPGLSELLPIYADAQAKAKMDAIDSLSVYFADSGEWSDNALRDGAWFIRQQGLRSPGYFHKGDWARAKTSDAFRKVDLGDLVGAGRFCMFSTPELNDVGQRLKDYDVFTFTYLSGYRTAFATTVMALLPLPEGFAVRLLRNVFRRNRLPVGGFVVVQVIGSSQGKRRTLTEQIVFDRGRDYWINGIVAATVARMISEKRAVQAGVHFLADAVDPNVVMAELRNAGVAQSEKFETRE